LFPSFSLVPILVGTDREKGAMSISDTELINAFTNYMTVTRAGSSGKLYNDTIGELNTKIIDLNGQISVLDGQEETYNQNYLNAKENPTNFGLFAKLGLRTTQDWVLAYFYFSYILFSILLLGTVLKASENKYVAMLFIGGITLSVGVLSTLLLLSYA